MKIIKIGLVALIILVVGSYAWLEYNSTSNYAAPDQQALAAIVGDQQVTVKVNDWMVMTPANNTTHTGLIVYPGAYCDISGYAPVLRRIASAGYFSVTVAMPFGMAILSPDVAAEVINSYPDIKHWIIVGHSLGGAMAGRFAANNPQLLSGIILWDSHPPESSSLVDSPLPVTLIHRATPDALPPRKFAVVRDLFPVNSQWIPIPGGQHMYFGSFAGGGYEEEWAPAITRAEQQEIVVAAMLQQIGKMIR
ncbi:alpha/beta hydrolase [Oceanicoccus sp. KOV_DT_Chl]|uniref:alpha/beta hydrolase n=1 Tax=Oceanicoccus sp. KOV_DT_Chl TaxID=1904639 RepID=UPI000C7B3686|nr:alpha/beta hydrolase [Oceanicoccus sp. KOV_DT_Chl]